MSTNCNPQGFLSRFFCIFFVFLGKTFHFSLLHSLERVEVLLMKKILILVLILSFLPLNAELLVNEFVTATGDDWVEITLKGEDCSMDVSSFFVTMYYGSNEPLAEEPVTLFSSDKKSTPYDDRFAVVHLNRPGQADETDRTGDSNGNGVLDIYCSNYYGSLWNTDGVVAIDTDDNPDNGGMVDFVAYSDRDSTPSDVISSYVESAGKYGMWEKIGISSQDVSVFTGPSGLKYGTSVSRREVRDSNTQADFSVTKFCTPGRENIFSFNQKGRKFFRPIKKKIILRRSRPGQQEIELQVFEICNIRFRIFSSAGREIYRSDLIREVLPGNVMLSFKGTTLHAPGLYLCHIDASSSKMKSGETTVVFIIVRR